MGSDSITVQNDVIGPYPNDSCKVLFQVCKIKFINYIFREIFQQIDRSFERKRNDIELEKTPNTESKCRCSKHLMLCEHVYVLTVCLENKCLGSAKCILKAQLPRSFCRLSLIWRQFVQVTACWPAPRPGRQSILRFFSRHQPLLSCE